MVFSSLNDGSETTVQSGVYLQGANGKQTSRLPGSLLKALEGVFLLPISLQPPSSGTAVQLLFELLGARKSSNCHILLKQSPRQRVPEMSRGKHHPRYFSASSPPHPCFLTHTFLGAGPVHIEQPLQQSSENIVQKPRPYSNPTVHRPQKRKAEKLEFGDEGKDDARLLKL